MDHRTEPPTAAPGSRGQGGRARRGVGPWPRRRLRAGVAGLGRLVLGIGTAGLALGLLLAVVATALLCLVGVGLLVAPAVLRGVRSGADLERARLARSGAEVLGPGRVPSSLRAALGDASLRRELAWLPVHAAVGLVAGVVGVQLAVYGVQYASAPLWWRLVPDGVSVVPGPTWALERWADAWTLALLGVGCAAAALVVAPLAAALQDRPGRALLGPPPGTDLSLRVAELTATRAAALDAHAAELRRIERSLHDGSQNRLVTVAVLLGAARRALARDPTTAEELLERAQSAAELALAELREVVRSILPPVLTDRGLAGALSALAASSTVPCRVEVDVAGRCAAAVEATAYFVVAEALTNAARHSGASRVEVLVRRRGGVLGARVSDDGRGGADEGAGSGLAGIRRRVRAVDGTMTVTSPPGGPTTVDVELPCAS